MKFTLVIVVFLYLFAATHVMVEHGGLLVVCHASPVSQDASHSGEFDFPLTESDHSPNDHCHFDSFLKGGTLSWANGLQQVVSSPVVLGLKCATHRPHSLVTMNRPSPATPIFLEISSLLL